MTDREPDNRRYSQSLPRDTIMILEIHAAELTAETGVRTTRTDLVKLAVHEFINSRGLRKKGGATC